MQNSQSSTFKGYLLEKGILILEEECERDNSWKLEDKTAKHILKVIADLQWELKGYTGLIGSRLPNCIGELVEGCKVQIRRLKRDISNINKYSPMNNFEKELMMKGDYFLERAEKSIDGARNSGYIEMIYRSMRANEICIGNINPDNIGRTDRLFIKDISRCAYNLMECDAIKFLSRAKRKGCRLNYNELIKEYVESMCLEPYSEKFITAMINYPYEFMKACSRYRSSKKNWTEEEYVDSLREAYLKDGEEV
ncbi:hypothetical protein [Clostridium polynesiense]|uniref:hypothetical protein n=1 Tax=Clostridium polynesiense TaxID=1325933 RepID=UPI0005902C97|nr:hypothetical protein [Clostridium polynesiense]